MQIVTPSTGPTHPAVKSLGLITLLMGLAQLVITSDFSIISVALPTIGRDLQIAPALLPWIISANAITFAGFLIVGGRLTDIFGHRLCLLFGFVLFGVGSLLSALGQDIWTLIASRSLQGLGAAVISPASFSLIAAFLPEGKARHRALGVFGVMQGLSVIVGLVVGGFLTTRLGWRSVFFVNMPIVLVGLALAWRVLPKVVVDAVARRTIDFGGAVVIVVATGLLLSAASLLSEHGVGSPLGLGLLLASVAAFGLFVLIEARHPQPLLPLPMFSRRDLTVASLACMALIGAVGGLFVLSSVYMQSGLKLSAALSGLGMVPVAVATMAAGQVAPLLMKWWSLRTVALGGLALQIVGLALLALTAPHGSYFTSVAPFGFLATFGSTSAFIALMGLAVNDAPPNQQGAASALLFTAQQIGLPIGVTISLAVFTAAGTAAVGLDAYRAGFLAPAVIAAAGFCLVLLLIRRARLSVSQEQEVVPAGE